MDKNPLTVSSALMAGLHMFPKAPDVVKVCSAPARVGVTALLTRRARSAG